MPEPVVGIIVVLWLTALIVGSGAARIWLARSTSPAAGRVWELLGLRKKRGADIDRMLSRWFNQPAVDTALWQAFAASRGWMVVPDASIKSQLAAFDVLPWYSSCVIGQVVEWSAGPYRCTLVPYTFSTGDGSAEWTLVHVDTTHLRLPAFRIRNENLGHKLFYSRRDVDFDDDAPFSQRFHLEAPDHTSVRSLFDAGVRAAVVAVGIARLQCAESRLVFMEPQLRSMAELNSLVDDDNASSRRFRATSPSVTCAGPRDAVSIALREK